MLIKGLLKKFQVKPDIVNNGLEAVEQGKAKDFDLTLMSCEMQCVS